MDNSLKNYLEKCIDLKDKDEFHDVFDDEMEDRLIHWKGYIDDEAAGKLRDYALKAV